MNFTKTQNSKILSTASLLKIIYIFLLRIFNTIIFNFAGRVSIAPDATVETIPPELPEDEIPETRFVDYFKVVKGSHMRALMWKNFLWMWRNIPVMAFIIGTLLQTTLLL